MDLQHPRHRQVFFEVHQGLPREGPGSRASTLRALALVPAMSAGAGPRQVLDVGCGPGMQTLDLASALPHARFLALDLHPDFLSDLRGRLARSGLESRVDVVRADMRRLPVADGSVDLVWCEGAAYIMGIEQALASWWRVLQPGASCAFTEAVWLRDDAPQPLRAWWAAYPAMADVDACRALIRRRGYELRGDFVLPRDAWWADYYRPMERRLDELARRHASDADALAVLAECREEIDAYRRYADWYGYAFFVARKPLEAR